LSSSIKRSHYGNLPNGTSIEIYTLTNSSGCVCKVTTFGAAITELWVPDRNGKLGDVVLGFDGLDGYLARRAFKGSGIGRVANRIANGTFTLDRKTYTLAINNPPNTLHGGITGFDRVVWTAEAVETPDGPSVVLHHVSPDGDEGFPGTLRVRMTYSLTNEDELRINYEATTDKATPINLTNHGYFNLAGGGDVLGHVLEINAHKYTVSDETLIPTGEIADVAGGPLDFTVEKPIGRDIGKITARIGGYDHNFVLDEKGHGLFHAASVHDPVSGRAMDVLTQEPGIQLFTSNHFDGTVIGKKGVPFPRYGAFCLETQHFPDSVNKPEFPSTILRPGETFRSATVYQFSVRND
jgi:aldose 1-epimerase